MKRRWLLGALVFAWSGAAGADEPSGEPSAAGEEQVAAQEVGAAADEELASSSAAEPAPDEAPAALSVALPSKEKPAASSDGGPERLTSTRFMCHEVCPQDEACVHGRCVRACSPACRAGTYCSPSGQCLSIRIEEDPETESELLQRVGAASANATEAAVLDLGGILFQGIRAGYEWGVIDAFVMRLQLMNTGLMSYAVEPKNEFERFEFGFGTSVGYRHYEALWGHLRGFYFGGGAQYQIVHVVDDNAQHYARTTHLVAPYGEFGYRWVFGSVLFSFGPQLSIRFPVGHGLAAHGPRSCVDDGTCAPPGAARFEGTLSLEVGFLQ